MKKDHLTIIFMKNTDLPRTFEISIKFLILLVVLFVGATSTYAFFIKGYYSLYKDNSKLEFIIRSLKTEIGQLQISINRLNNQNQTAETNVKPESEPTETAADSLMEDNLVTVQELSLEPDPATGRFRFSFILNKMTDDEQTARGYVFVVLLDSRTGRKMSSFPDVEFQNGVPANYRLGDRYMIRRFKGYRGELKLTGRADTFMVLVYSDVGKLHSQLKRHVGES